MFIQLPGFSTPQNYNHSLCRYKRKRTHNHLHFMKVRLFIMCVFTKRYGLSTRTGKKTVTGLVLTTDYKIALSRQALTGDCFSSSPVYTFTVTP